MSEKIYEQTKGEPVEVQLDASRAITGVIRDIEIWPMLESELESKVKLQKVEVLKALKEAERLEDPGEKLRAIQGAESKAMDSVGGNMVGWKLDGVAEILYRLASTVAAELLPETKWKKDVRRLNLLELEMKRLDLIKNRLAYPESWDNVDVTENEKEAIKNLPNVQDELRELRMKLHTEGKNLRPNDDELKGLKENLKLLEQTLISMMRSPEFRGCIFNSNNSSNGLDRDNVNFIDGSRLHFGFCSNPGFSGPFFGIDDEGPLLATFLNMVVKQKRET